MSETEPLPPEGDGRRSAPPLLRALSQFKAYIVAITTAIAAATALYHLIQDLPWWIPAIVVGVPVLMVAVHFVFLRPRSTPAPPETAFRLDPWTGSTSDRERFDRPDDAHEKILGWVSASPKPLLYITGESGVGKSSLLEAFVIPRLREDSRFAVVSTRAFGDPIKQLATALYQPGTLWDRPPAVSDDPDQMLSQAAGRAKQAGERLIVVIDQFEELLRREGGEPESGAALLARHAVQPVPNLTFVLCFRNDWLGTPGQRGLPQPHQGDNWAFVDAFSPGAASRYLVANGIGDAGLAQQLVTCAREVDDIAEGVRPITINMVGRIATQMPDLAGHLAPRRGSGAKLFHAFVSRTLGRGQPREEVLAILRRLITPAGDRRPPVSEAELATEVRASPGAVVKATRDLERQGLLRVAGDGWEVSHDFVARVLHGVVERARASWLRTSRRYLLPVGTAAWLIATPAVVWLWHAERLARWKGEFELSTAVQSDGTIVFNRPSGDALRYISSGAVPSTTAIKLHELSIDNNLKLVANIGTLQTLDLSGTGITNDGLAHLARLEGLQTLVLQGTDITNDGMDHLAQIKGLQSLGLVKTSITDAGLLQFARFDKLNTLDLSYNTNITNDGMAYLARLEGLQTLVLQGTDISNDGLDHLARLEGLQTLDLSDTGVTDAGLDHLVQLNRLHTLTLRFTGITNDGMAHLARLEGLQTLALGFTNITNAGLTHLSRLEGLQTLALDNTRITNDGLAHLAQLGTIQTLDLSRTGITNDGMAYLARLEGLQTLVLQGTDITDDGLDHLARLDKLQTLDLSHNHNITNDGLDHLAQLEGLQTLVLWATDTTNDGVRRLREARPELEIEH